MAITFDVSIIERSNFGIIISIIDFDISNKQKTFFFAWVNPLMLLPIL